jgi:hypothetical protein
MPNWHPIIEPRSTIHGQDAHQQVAVPLHFDRAELSNVVHSRVGVRVQQCLPLARTHLVRHAHDPITRNPQLGALW